MKRIVIHFLVTPLFLGRVLSQEPSPEKTWDVNAGLGFLVSSSNPKTTPSGSIFSNPTGVELKSYDDEIGNETRFSFFPVFKIVRNFSDGRLTVGSLPGYMLGAKYDFNVGDSKVDTFLAGSIRSEYDNLYDLNTDRSVTNKTVSAFSIGYTSHADRKSPYGFSLRAIGGIHQLNSDDTTKKSDLLGRSGRKRSIIGGIKLLLLNIRYGDIDYAAKGEADSYQGNSFNLGLFLPVAKGLFFRLGHVAENLTYRATHPIFNLTRKDFNESLIFMTNWKISDRYNLNFVLNRKTIDSNIDFFDGESVTAITSLSYGF